MQASQDCGGAWSQADLEQKVQREKALAEAEGRAREARANEDVNRRTLTLRLEEERKKLVEAINTTFGCAHICMCMHACPPCGLLFGSGRARPLCWPEQEEKPPLSSKWVHMRPVHLPGVASVYPCILGARKQCTGRMWVHVPVSPGSCPGVRAVCEVSASVACACAGTWAPA